MRTARQPASMPHVLFISYNGLIEPLGLSQILPYVRGLASSYHMSLLSFEKRVRSAADDAAAQNRVVADLAERGIGWERLRYHKRPSLPATLFDIAHGIVRAVRLTQREPIALIHARGYVPAAIVWGIKRWLKIP